MKWKKEYKWLLAGVFASLIIIYLTKINTIPAKSKWVYDLGQYLWFNLAISYLSSFIFYWIVVYLPERRKQKKFLFQMGMEIQMIHLKGWRFFFYLRNASGMENDIQDTSKITPADIDKMLEKVTPETVHTFINEPGQPSQTFQEYLALHRIEMNDAISNALVIPYEDLDVYSALLFHQRTGMITGREILKNNSKFNHTEILSYYVQLKVLNNHFNKYYYPFLLDSVKPNKIKIWLSRKKIKKNK